MNKLSGRLVTQQKGWLNTLLPENDETVCGSDLSSQPCFLAGGELTNLLPTQAALNTLWMRQHNRIAERLQVIDELFSFEYLKTTFLVSNELFFCGTMHNLNMSILYF